MGRHVGLGRELRGELRGSPSAGNTVRIAVEGGSVELIEREGTLFISLLGESKINPSDS